MNHAVHCASPAIYTAPLANPLGSIDRAKAPHPPECMQHYDVQIAWPLSLNGLEQLLQLPVVDTLNHREDITGGGPNARDEPEGRNASTTGGPNGLPALKTDNTRPNGAAHNGAIGQSLFRKRRNIYRGRVLLWRASLGRLHPQQALLQYGLVKYNWRRNKGFVKPH